MLAIFIDIQDALYSSMISRRVGGREGGGREGAGREAHVTLQCGFDGYRSTSDKADIYNFFNSKLHIFYHNTARVSEE